MKIVLYLFVFILLSSSCQKSASCKYNAPEAIFSENINQVERHNFAIRNQTGIENLKFNDGSNLTVYQSGCDFIKQDFEFEVNSPSDTIGSDFWINLSIDKFRYLGKLDSQYYSFASWAQAIEQQSAVMKIAEFTEVQPGFYAKVDAIVGKEKSTLRITLSEQP